MSGSTYYSLEGEYPNRQAAPHTITLLAGVVVMLETSGQFSETKYCTEEF
ncbi:MAG: hypothetical protein JWM21_39 [Acidobacteria bacterium]|nr:hypothetical protein [Acidobacteriota bacterium]